MRTTHICKCDKLSYYVCQLDFFEAGNRVQNQNTSAEPSLPPGPRKMPVQKRSRERVERMLAVATELIAEKGSDALRMGEVAERSGVSIGSLYQFFPDKTALLG